jgi:hypothetical protein
MPLLVDGNISISGTIPASLAKTARQEIQMYIGIGTIVLIIVLILIFR